MSESLTKRKKDLIDSFKYLPLERRKPEREYGSPKGFITHSHHHKSKEIASLMGEMSGANDIHVAWSNINDLMKQFKTEPYFLSPQTLDDLLETELPSIGTPYQDSIPILEVILPSGHLLDDENDSIYCLVIVDYEVANQMAGYKIFGKGNGELPRYTIFAFTECGALFNAPIFNDADIKAIAEGEGVISDAVTMNTLDRIKAVGLNLLLMLEAYPEYIRHTPIPNQAKGFGRSNKTILAPRVISADSLVRKQTPQKSQQKTPRIGTPKSPHIRKGHWRRSRHGQGRRQYRWNWIQPKRINF
jgi:hypothetical protein